MSSRFEFVDLIGSDDESSVYARSRPVEFELPSESDFEGILAGANAINSDFNFSASGNVLSVLLPPEIEVGNGKKDLKEVLFLAGAHADIGRLGATAAFCCAKEGGCCVRW